MGMGFENCEVGVGKKMNWEMGFVPPLQDPLKGVGRGFDHCTHSKNTNAFLNLEMHEKIC